MKENKVTIKLTDDQQKRIKEATGKSITELNIDLASLNEAELNQAAGGVNWTACVNGQHYSTVTIAM